MRDVCIIGCGIVGSTLAYELSAYDLDVLVLEKELDIAFGASRANYAVIHAGYDPEPGSLMAKYTVNSSERMNELSEKLGFTFHQCGSLLVSRNEQEDLLVKERYERGIENGVLNLSLLDKKECLALESGLTTDIRMALLAENSGVVNPWDYVVAFSQVALREGVDFYLDHEVLSINKCDGYYEIVSNKGKIQCKYIINAAGVDSAEIHNMVSDEEVELAIQKASFYLFDNANHNISKHILFTCPDNDSRGIIAAPTASGHYIVGENCELMRDKYCTKKSLTFETVIKQTKQLLPNINANSSYRTFVGERLSTEVFDDFVIGFADERFFDCAAIRSPGLSAAPAMAKDVVEQVIGKMGSNKKIDWDGSLSKSKLLKHYPNELSKEVDIDEDLIIRILNRCETVTSEEIVWAIESGLRVSALDWVKPREGTKMGRCLGGLSKNKS